MNTTRKLLLGLAFASAISAYADDQSAVPGFPDDTILEITFAQDVVIPAQSQSYRFAKQTVGGRHGWVMSCELNFQAAPSDRKVTAGSKLSVSPLILPGLQRAAGDEKRWLSSGPITLSGQSTGKDASLECYADAKDSYHSPNDVTIGDFRQYLKSIGGVLNVPPPAAFAPPSVPAPDRISGMPVGTKLVLEKDIVGTKGDHVLKLYSCVVFFDGGRVLTGDHVFHPGTTIQITAAAPSSCQQNPDHGADITVSIQDETGASLGQGDLVCSNPNVIGGNYLIDECSYDMSFFNFGYNLNLAGVVVVLPASKK